MTTDITEKPTTTAASNQQPVTTIREGAVAASIWRRQSSAGLEYFEFSLSRSWKSKSGDKEGYSQNFFESNEAAVVQVVTEACRFIRSRQTEPTVTDPNGEPLGDDLEMARHEGGVR